MSENNAKKRGRKRSIIKPPSKKLKLEASPSKDRSIFPINPIISFDFLKNKNKSSNELLQDYQELHSSFTTICSFHQSKTLIKNIAKIIESQFEIDGQSLIEMLNAIQNDLAMSDFELLTWAAILERINAKEFLIPIRNLLSNFAFVAKSSLNDGMEPFQAFMVSKRPNFVEEYNEWIKTVKDSFSINLRDINQKYKELRKTRDDSPAESISTCYSIYVDDELNLTSPYDYDILTNENGEYRSSREDPVTPKKTPDFPQFEKSESLSAEIEYYFKSDRLSPYCTFENPENKADSDSSSLLSAE